ncbi:EamA family transporter [Nisaea sp.]|uniref:DMT family transporter n=1 Tax=Nisaea sp. TaxID=2024842 RepID=UPI0025E00348|nr:EamA family transporter [Nisaea sp.]
MNARVNLTMGPVEWGILILLSAVWGGSFFFVGVAVADVPPLTIVLVRVGLAALVMQMALPLFGLRMPTDWKALRAFLIMGFLNNAVPFSLIVFGQTRIASGLASIFLAATPIFGVLVAHFMTDDERIKPLRVLGVAFGFAGVALMVGEDLSGGIEGTLLGQIALLGAALSYAFGGVFGRRFKGMGIEPVQTATGQVTASTLLLIPAVILVDRPWTLPMPSTGTIASLAGLALLCTSFAYILYFELLKRAGAMNLLLVTLLVPVSAILLGVLFLNESLSAMHLVGMALIATGLLAIDGRVFRKITAAREIS